MAGSRPPYRLDEDKKLLRYLLDGNYESVWSGNAIWVQMEIEDICPGRSWQSLKNRFKRNIMKDFSRPEYKLTKDELTRLKSFVLNKTEDWPKRKVDARLIRKRIERESDTNTNENIDHDNDEEDDRVPPEGAYHYKESSKKLPSPKKKQFLTLDTQWSDSD